MMKGRKYWVVLTCCFMWFGISCSGEAEAFLPLESAYTLGGQDYKIESKMYFIDGVKGEPDQLRLEQNIPGQEGKDVIVLLPVQGPGEIDGSYLFSKTGDIGTYDLVYLKNRQGDAYDWITNGDTGAKLKIVYEGIQEGQETYTLILEDFDLNYGNWDFIGGKWNSKGNIPFSFQYQGVIADMP